MSLVSLLETMMEILKETLLTESRGSASLGRVSCYDPQTCRAPIFISLTPSFLIKPILAPFILIPTDLYLSIALIR